MPYSSNKKFKPCEVRCKQLAKLSDPIEIEKRLAKQKESRSKALKAIKNSSSNTPRKPIKSKGLKGRAINKHESTLQEKIASIGCICCINKGWVSSSTDNQNWVSLHHTEGRVNKHAHAKVLPLCQWHHQVEPPKDSPENLFPIHGHGKKVWESVNGSQEELLKQCYALINERMPWVDDD